MANTKLVNLVRGYCTDARFIFDTFKIGRYFSSKDPVPKSLISLVHNFSCAGCYVGETSCHYVKRVGEHFRTDKKSAVYKHLEENPAGKDSCNNDCFSIERQLQVFSWQ